MNEQRYAIVRDGVVENVVMWDGESDWTLPEGTTLVESDEAGPGNTYDGKSFTASQPTPAAVEPTLEEVLSSLSAEAKTALAKLLAQN